MNKIIKLIACMGVFLCAFLSVSKAYADITITPTRVVFEDRDRFSEVTLVNSGNKAETYDIGWQFYRMFEGREAPYELVESSVTEFDLTQHMVYTPRRVTLAPGAKQKIRLALRRPPEVQPGEYRAHMTFKGVRDDLNTDGQAATTTSAAVKINVSYSIPVVFRAGEPDIAASIDNVSFQRNPNNGLLEALVTISRSGSPYGVLGHLFVYDPTGKVIGEISNAHIFPEIQTRIFKVPLTDESNISGGNIKLVLKHYSKDEGKIYAERLVPVQ